MALDKIPLLDTAAITTDVSASSINVADVKAAMVVGVSAIDVQEATSFDSTLSDADRLLAELREEPVLILPLDESDETVL
jgi:hypothetical protein